MAGKRALAERPRPAIEAPTDAALLTAQLYSPAEIIMIDLDENRLRIAKQLGATQLVDTAGSKAVERVLELSGGAELITHRFNLSEIMSAYDTFAHAAENRALKVIIVN